MRDLTDEIGYDGWHYEEPLVARADDAPAYVATVWQERAACLDVSDPDVFFPSGSSDNVRIEEAIAICATCPVAQECAGYRERMECSDGVWGGVYYQQGRATEPTRRGRPKKGAA